MKKIIQKLLLLTTALFAAHSALAVTSLKQVQVSGGNEIDLLFDGKVSKSQIKTEYINDIIQIVLTDAAVYPAKISSVSGGNISKIFAYQYAPKVVRCRLTVKGKAEAFKNTLSINTNGKMLTVQLEPAAAKSDSDSQAQTAKAPVVSDQELLDRVISSQSAPQNKTQDKAQEKALDKKSEKQNTSSSASSTAAQSIQSAANHASEQVRLTAGKEGPGLIKFFAKVALVFGFLGLLLLLAKKLLGQGLANTAKNPKSGLMSAISKFAVKGFGPKGKLIEVIATHYLGPKKSIHILKVAEKTLVIGVTSEAITLISELDSEEGLLKEYDRQETKAVTSSVSSKVSSNTNAAAKSENRSNEPKNEPQNMSQNGSKMGAITQALGPSIFADLLGQETGRHTAAKPGIQNYQANAQPVQNVEVSAANPALQAFNATASQSSVRNQIRSKLEGLKQL